MIKNKKNFLGSLLSLLGLGGCIVPMPCMYGTPTADLKLIGDVKNRDGEPVEGIRVVMKPFGEVMDEHGYLNDTLYTDANGHFELERLKFDTGALGSDALVLFDDVDGEAHGSYASRKLEKGELVIEQTREGKGWDEGAFTVRADVTLDKK